MSTTIPAPFLLQHEPASILPIEFVQVLNEAYFLHLLATDPEKVIPPGKSLLSMMTHARIEHDEGTEGPDKVAQLTDRVKQVVHRAFWSEALEAISSSEPSVQLPRLKGLIGDILEAIAPLFPPQDRIIQTLSSPLPPTSSPLHTTLELLKEILRALRKRCAPIRDATIDEILDNLQSSPPFHPSMAATTNGSTSNTQNPPSPLAQLLLDTIKSILSLAEDMKSDLTTFVLGSMGEDQLRGIVSQQAEARERKLVEEIWGGRERVVHEWQAWVQEVGEIPDTIPSKKWIIALTRALGADKPVSCDLPAIEGSSKDEKRQENGESPQLYKLPPQFLFSSPTLLYIQNYLQALVIAASLRSLTHLPSSSFKKTMNPGHDFTQRVWTLLKAEVDAEDTGKAEDQEATKIINLADEVVRARQFTSPSGTIDADEESRLRSAVDRTLKPRDPVFLLLQSRLMAAFGKQLLSPPQEQSSSHYPSAAIPQKMQSGRDHAGERPGKRPRLMFDANNDNAASETQSGHLDMDETLFIKGFEDPVLVRATLDVLRKTSACILWTNRVWGDTV
ncbi:hypothetical protein BDQ12DRAFT_673556 [Crucibulum laeve]|uniref:T-complex protein 11-domain-containing protein n=1 Tax=Crucibulum laeve TaxID=68775 RepID=A0A5C3MJD1_9AGAR|nr:hypothetical protein BDQ12DRAFT_673556 [Crucibulum laeve]